MSLIPVDESDAGGHGGEQEDDDRRPRSAVRRALSRVGSGLRRVGGAILSTLPSPRPRRSDSGAVDRDSLPDRTGSSALAERVEYDTRSDETLARESSTPMRALPGADSPSLEGPDDDPPELTARWDDDELTLQAPGEPGATITSDVWEDVER